MFLYVEKWTLKSEKSREKKVKKAFEQWIKKNWCEALLSTKAGKREKKLLFFPIRRRIATLHFTSLHRKRIFFFCFYCLLDAAKSLLKKANMKKRVEKSNSSQSSFFNFFSFHFMCIYYLFWCWLQFHGNLLCMIKEKRVFSAYTYDILANQVNARII